MPNGYRRQTRVLPSPWLGLGAGLGNIMGSYFEAKRGKKEAELENVGRVFERVTLTGDPEPLARLIEENPDAAEAFRARTGIDIFRMTIPEPGEPEAMPLEPPSTEAPLPPVREIFEGVAQPPGAIMPPAMVSAPQELGPTDVPWPVDPQGMQARATQEKIAGRELPEALQKPEPSPLKVITDEYKGIGTTLEKLPTQRHKEAFLQAIEPHMPQGFPTEYTGEALEPPTPKEIELIWKLYPNMTDEQFKTWRETRIAPFEAPAKPETDEMRMTISEFLRAYPHASDEEWVAFLESEGATIPQKAPRIQSDKNTEVSLFNRSMEMAMLTGESQPEIYQFLANPQMEGAEEFQKTVLPKYLEEKVKVDEIRMLRWMLLDAYKVGDEEESKKMLQRISTLTGIPYEPRRNIKEQILDFLRGTQKYSGSAVPEVETESAFDKAFKER